MNDFSSKLIFLGTGTGVPSAERASPAILLKLANIKLLIDLGPGTLRQLARASSAITEIDYILLTHLHPDHSADLVPFLFAGKYPPYLVNRGPCTLFAGSDIDPFYQALQDLYGRWIEWPQGLFTVISLPQDQPWERGFPDFSLLSSPLDHTSSSLGYRITLSKGKSLVFSGDSDYSSSLVELAQGADLLVCECSFPEGQKVPGHLTPSLAGRIAREAGVSRLILTHFYPECLGRDLVGPCAREYNGPITLAEDFQTINL
jgi:ribonuclease BN (tRNA processing enzyme)